MCGIFSYITNNNENILLENDKNIYNNFMKIKNRGPDNSQYLCIKNNIILGFHRLSINDISDLGNQPMKLKDYYLICNGEIFNHKNIINKYNFNTKSDSDCEVILHLYDYYLNTEKISKKSQIIKSICNELDGEFAFVLYDSNIETSFIARDPFGVRPLFYGTLNNIYNDNEIFVFSSELKGLNSLVNNAKQFTPGHYMIISKDMSFLIDKYHEIVIYNTINQNNILENLNYVFRNAVYKRMMSDKEICSLLSGGLDSSLVASILSEKLGPNKLKTFSIGIKGSPDLKYAQQVADHIKSVHYSIELTEKQFLDSIEEVIYAIESYDTTTVRASVGNYLVSKFIKQNTNCKVIFNGDYADEVCGGYKYFKNTSDDDLFHNECIRLINNIHYFDCLRSDRSISNNGLEARVPFADKEFVNFYLSIPANLRRSNDKIEKCLLRKAFENDNLLPESVLWRYKEAFSDGVTDEKRSWHTIIHEYVNKKINDKQFNNLKNQYHINKPVLKESVYYRTIFDKYYKGFDNIIPYYWMPKWCGEITDPSAREIKSV